MARRNTGQEYDGRTGKTKAAVRFDPSVDCCKRLTTSCVYHSIDENERKCMFDDFWGMGSYNLQNAHMFGLINRLATARTRNRKQSDETRRSFTYSYHLRDNSGQRRHVCKKAFLRVFGITCDRLRTIRGEL